MTADTSRSRPTAIAMPPRRGTKLGSLQPMRSHRPPLCGAGNSGIAPFARCLRSDGRKLTGFETPSSKSIVERPAGDAAIAIDKRRLGYFPHPKIAKVCIRGMQPAPR